MKDRLKKLRRSLGLKQREVADRLGIATGTVGQWECGDGTPGEARIYQICNEFHVRRNWLLFGEGEMFEPDTDEREAQKQFVIACFESLPESKRAVFLDALREYVCAHCELKDKPVGNNTIVGDVNGTINVNQTFNNNK